MTSSPSPRFTLPRLPYAYDALEPVLGAELMELHHSKHHAAYVSNLNAALDKCEEAERRGDLEAIVQLQPTMRFNAGGHVNHSMFWENLCPPGKGGKPEGPLAEAIVKRWGSLEGFKTEFNAKATSVQGSGWCWLAVDPTTKGLSIVTTANQDPCATLGLRPILGVDVWEHAYYLTYKNARGTYLTAIWEIVNWHDVSRRFADAAKV